MLCLSFNVKGKKNYQVNFLNFYIYFNILKKLKYTFQTQKWYFICITHEYKFLGTSQLKLYVNSQHFSFPIAFPKILEVKFFF